MTVLVTGATGFLGTNLVRALAARNIPVRILRRATSDMRGLEGLPLDELIGDVRDVASVRRAVSGCRRIYHLAAAMDMSPAGEKKLEDINVRGTENIINAALDEGVDKIVYTSSSVTVGYGSGQAPATEARGIEFRGLKLPYIDAKIRCERLVLDACNRGLPAVVVVPGYVFGPWDKSPKLNQLLIMAAKGALNFYFSGGLSVVDVEDVARGHILAMEKGRIGERYILSNENMSYRGFISALNRHVDKPPPRWKIPEAVLLAFGYGAQWWSGLSGKDVGLSSAMARLYALEHYISSDKASNELGYETTPLETSLARTFAWLRQYGYIA